MAALGLLLEYLGNRQVPFPGVASCYMKECLSKNGARVERHSLSTFMPDAPSAFGDSIT